jgi:hypothetical protein
VFRGFCVPFGVKVEIGFYFGGARYGNVDARKRLTRRFLQVENRGGTDVPS